MFNVHLDLFHSVHPNANPCTLGIAEFSLTPPPNKLGEAINLAQLIGLPPKLLLFGNDAD
jgi:hypothetical protein